MGFDIDFGNLQAPNPFAAMAQGQDFAARQATRKASAQAGRQLASGDRQGAMQSLGSVGALDDVRSLQADDEQAKAAKAKQRAATLLQVTAGLEKIPEGARKQALMSAYPLFQAAEIDTSHFDPLTEDQLTNQNLQIFAGNVAKEVEQYTLGPGMKRYDATGKLVAEAPFAPQYKSVGKDDTLVEVGGGNGSTPTPHANGGGGGFDNFVSQYLLPTEGGYAPNDGNGAPVNMGINQKSNPDVNVAELTPDQAKQIYHDRYWAPSGADKLPPGLAEVQADTAINMGVGPAQQLLQQSGGDVQKYLQLREQRYRSIAQANPDKARFLPTWLDRNAKLGQYVGGLGGATPQAQGGSRVIAQGSNVGAAGSAGKADPNIVKGLLEGRIMPPTQKAAASDYWQAQLQAAAEQDPKFDMVDFGARAKTRSDFTSGKSAQNITALNTVIGHLDHLDRTIDGLGNYGGFPGSTLNNVFAHKIAEASGTDSRIKDFETAKIAVANELTRVFRGSGGAEADIQAWQKQLNGASSPQALHKVVQSMAELINSRVEALGEQYSQGMGTTKDPITLLTPDKQKAFQRLMGGQSRAAAPAVKGGKAAHQMSDAELKAALGL